MRKLFFGVYIFSFLQTCFAQDQPLTFGRLSRPEKWWAVKHLFVANKAKKITEEARIASHEIKNDSLLDGDESGGQVDAFRHSYWMALLAQKISKRKALSLGKAHEKGDYIKFKKKEINDESILPDSISSVMDLFNNEVGAGIGFQNKSLQADSLKLMILSSIRQGKMRIISKDSSGNFFDCAEKQIDLTIYFGKWDIPKCLVPSNQIPEK